MTSYWLTAIGVFACAGCAAPQEQAVTPAPSSKSGEAAEPDLKITPLEDVIKDGDYNNDRPPETQVPGTGTVTRDIPKDPFLERVERREDNSPK